MTNNKRIIVFIASLLIEMKAFAQTQYDYYEDKDVYGGVDTAIGGLKIFGIVVLIIVVILVLCAIYGFFAGWFKVDKKEKQINTSENKDKNIEHAIQSQFGKNGLPLPKKPYDAITIVGKSIDAFYTCIDGSKHKETFWYNIRSIKYHGYEIKDSIGHLHNIPIEYVLHHGLKIDSEDIINNSEKDLEQQYWLYFEGDVEFEPEKLHLRKIIDGFDLIDSFWLHYDGYIYSKQLYTAMSNRVKYPDFFNY